ncbi:hypothetical protein DERF_001188 [Dermatophagoides farinae]|uniref:Transmembrane protein n=1 Tax=Dermatophagoides farinae TaxID=6954 RepID=A0A922IEG9_DERFA|nr:hypothetical protein DERF_001188 [Dermatophagoides farinae]
MEWKKNSCIELAFVVVVVAAAAAVIIELDSFNHEHRGIIIIVVVVEQCSLSEAPIHCGLFCFVLFCYGCRLAYKYR